MRLLDLYCGAGGAGAGYHRAGFEVVGVDIAPQPNYPFEFHQGDALDFLAENWREFAVVHASPPCQRYTHGNAGSGKAGNWPDLIGPTRDACQSTGRPYVIENVPRSPLRNPLMLCGTMFNLTATDDDGTPLYLRRHRWFEANLPLLAPGRCDHPRGVQWAGVYGGARRDKVEARTVRKGGYVPPNVDVLRELIGADWMTERGLFEAIPPAYTHWIGDQARDYLAVAA